MVSDLQGNSMALLVWALVEAVLLIPPRQGATRADENDCLEQRSGSPI